MGRDEQNQCCLLLFNVHGIAKLNQNGPPLKAASKPLQKSYAYFII